MTRLPGPILVVSQRTQVGAENARRACEAGLYEGYTVVKVLTPIERRGTRYEFTIEVKS